MEEILASIRKIIADDQILPLTRPAAGLAAARPAQRPVEQSPPDDSDIHHDVQDDEGETARPSTQPSAEAPRTSPSLHTMSDFEAAFAELRPSFSAAPAVAKAEEVHVQAPEPAAVEPVPAPAAPRVEQLRPIAQEEAVLVSPSTGASVSSAFNALATTMFLQNTGMVEEAIRDMLRPMLKQWLDDNLPTMVERLVRAEIERVARGGR
jgi:cell pole-organizing protein PopZ